MSIKGGVIYARNEGFLLGEIKAEAKNSITDSQMDDVEFTYIIDIQKFIPCYNLHSFYSSVYEIDEPSVKKYLSDHKKDVVGWYKFRRNTRQEMTFQERVLHRNLQNYLSNPELVFLLTTTSTTSDNNSTHRLEYAIHKPQESISLRVPLVVTNLGLSELQDYKTVSGSCTSSAFSRAVKKHRSDFFNEDGSLIEVTKINKMYSTLQDELKKICSKVEASERSVQRLLDDVNSLRKRIAEKKMQCISDKSKEEKDENVFLCQALKTFFPGSELLQARTLTFRGRYIPKYCCRIDHGINITDQLTLMMGESNVLRKKTTHLRKRKTDPSENQEKSVKKSRLSRKLSDTGDIDSSDMEKLTLSGTETEDDLLDVCRGEREGTQSPTF
ncbi:BRCA1-A complex subunit Abraxas 1 isoform X2 [Protopterus annectens]|uniref:BRCA1-A complex subunit Abraxas 1 isoform X2 n=1 Tax=Protopterus annectens TaxID=7888 RepID=UPI001CF9C1E6|nr:BRCA1-A complex subunit Abraxas 1 isoform X2 [Protopterus annectens]